uniref:Uncharacterized protein n=1 Tax=Knipowitschia caucasica TaxID=637954 RepID=A0AAV2J142_KNICA
MERVSRKGAVLDGGGGEGAEVWDELGVGGARGIVRRVDLAEQSRFEIDVPGGCLGVSVGDRCLGCGENRGAGAERKKRLGVGGRAGGLWGGSRGGGAGLGDVGFGRKLGCSETDGGFRRGRCGGTGGDALAVERGCEGGETHSKTWWVLVSLGVWGAVVAHYGRKEAMVGEGWRGWGGGGEQGGLLGASGGGG